MTVMKKRFLTIFLSLLMVRVMMPMGMWTTYAAGGNLSPDEDGYYLIEDYADLKAFADLVNDGNTSANAKLTADIDCNGNKDWVPIADFNSNYDIRYSGTFDGAGHIINDLSNKAGGDGADSQGLFGIVGNVGRVANVGLEGGSITGNDFVGGVAGLSYGEITNCYNIGEVSGNSRVGGVIGENYGGKVTNCYNGGKVSGDSRVGGVAGENNKGTITNCYNGGKVSGDSRVGGVAGENYKGEITNCYNIGEASGDSRVGGVTGKNNIGKITNCYNTGTISGNNVDNNVGGVAGENYKGEITNCYNIGKVCEGSVVGVIGGVVGLNDEGNVKYCYNDKTINGDVGPVGNNLQGTELNYVTSIYSSQLTGTNSIDVFTDPDPWLTKADDKDTDASEYYWYYPHLKGFDYDNSLEVKDWPPKVTVKVNWDEAEAYTYNGFSQKPAVKKLTISNGATVVTAKPDKDYTVSYYAKDGDTYTAVTEDIINVGLYKAVIEFKAGGHATIEKEFEIKNAPQAVTDVSSEPTISEAEEENTDDEGDDVDDNGGGSKGSKKNVNTGDESLIAFWASLLGVSLIGLIMLFAAKLRLRRKDR